MRESEKMLLGYEEIQGQVGSGGGGSSSFLIRVEENKVYRQRKRKRKRGSEGRIKKDGNFLQRTKAGKKLKIKIKKQNEKER